MIYSQLRAFHAVATQGSFTKAAKVLHVTQPTLSDHVRALEKRYGVKLFKRQGRGVALTSLGRALLEITQRQRGLESEAEQLLSTAKGMLTGHLRIAADSPYLVVPLLGNFSITHPGVKLSMTFGSTGKVLQDLYDLKADIGVLSENNHDSRLDYRVYSKDRLIVFVQREHPWSKRRSIHLEELKEERLILREPGSITRSIFEQALQQKSIEPNVVMEADSREGVREAVAVGMGVGVVFESELGNDSRVHSLTVRDADLKVTEYIACLKETRPVPVVQAFYDLLESELEQTS
jgi:LysR family transcriptional regulator, low CO2-responsive transcriptional regulator